MGDDAHLLWIRDHNFLDMWGDHRRDRGRVSGRLDNDHILSRKRHRESPEKKLRIYSFEVVNRENYADPADRVVGVQHRNAFCQLCLCDSLRRLCSWRMAEFIDNKCG